MVEYTDSVKYPLGQWSKLVKYIDNNRAERTIKSLVIGRNNWIFATPPKGADASPGSLYSIIETARTQPVQLSSTRHERVSKDRLRLVLEFRFLKRTVR